MGQYQKGREDGRAEAEASFADSLARREQQYNDAITAEHNRIADEMALLRTQVENLERQKTELEDRIAQTAGFTTHAGMQSMEEQKELLRKEETENVAARRGSRRGDDGVRYEVWMGWPSYQISESCRVFLGGKDGDGPFTEGKAHGFARSVRDLYELLLTTGRVGTIVTDPVIMTGNIGVFVRGGSSVDAARAASILRG